MTNSVQIAPAISVAVGGALGAGSRWLISSQAFVSFPMDWPVATLSVNLTGSFALGFAYTWLPGVGANTNLTLALTTGFLGAFTTFSTFAVESHRLIDARGYAWAVSYASLSVVLGIMLAVAGHAIATKLL